MKKDTIHLQYVGDVPAVEASNIKVGSILMWNCGSLCITTSVTPSKTGKTLLIGEKHFGKPDAFSDPEKIYFRKLRSNTLVALQ